MNISFQGVESGFALWLNGTYLGYSEDSFTPADFALTGALMKGRNRLAVRVFKWTPGSWFEDQDFFRFSGIFRGVFLYALPKTAVTDLSIVPELSDGFDRIAWYGLGPEDSYADRQRGARPGIFEKTVADNMARYPVPQESGNKCGVREMKIVDRRGRGLLASGSELSVNVLPYTPHELEYAAHPYELPDVHHTIVRVAMQQMGVGGDDSWGAKPHPEYLLPAERDLHFRFRFRGI